MIHCEEGTGLTDTRVMGFEQCECGSPVLCLMPHFLAQIIRT